MCRSARGDMPFARSVRAGDRGLAPGPTISSANRRMTAVTALLPSRTALSLLALVAAAFAWAAAPATATSHDPLTAGPAPLEVDLTEGVEVRTLGNGLTVVALADRRAPVVTHMVWYRAGAADEPPGKSGIAHYLEHLLFKGTPAVPAGVFSGAVAATGGQENAFTSQDATAYFQRVPPDLLPTVMAYEADRMVNLELTEAMIATEREVIKEERAQRLLSSPGAELGVAVDAALFPNHPYGTPIIGWPDEIAALTAEDALDFYRRFYRPDNAVVVVVGDVEPAEVFRHAEATYGAIQVAGMAPERARTAVPTLRATRTVELEDPRVARPNLSLAWIAPTYETAEPGEAEAIDLLAEVLSGSSTSRLYRRLVVEDEVAAGAGAYYSGNARDVGRFVLAVTPADGVSLEVAEDAIRAEIARIAETGVTEDELTRARDRLLVSAVFARDSQAAMARVLGAAFTGGSTLEEIRDWPARMAAVAPDDVRAAARRFTGDDLVRSVLRPADRDRATTRILPVSAPDRATAPVPAADEPAADGPSLDDPTLDDPTRDMEIAE